MNQQIEQQQQQHAWPGVLGKQGCWKRMHWTDWITSHQIYKILQTTHYSSLFIIIHHYSSLFIIILGFPMSICRIFGEDGKETSQKESTAWLERHRQTNPLDQRMRRSGDKLI
jgi:hypothetical protein